MEWLSIYAPTFPYVAMMLVICLPMMLRMMSDGTCDGSGASRDEAARLVRSVPPWRGMRRAHV